ncbi:hypothetical protein SO694_00002339 [Aureococcus anophagefferens]|uniref:Ion transport domain-containing protein n=1 Tax=Aureococcus anophagefferens TaxID=44056 RepID=A0ABR1GCJ0_AURAN
MMSCFNGQEAPADGEGVDLMELPAQDEQNTITRLTRPSRKAAKKARKTAVKKKARTEEIMVSEDSADDDEAADAAGDGGGDARRRRRRGRRLGPRGARRESASGGFYSTVQYNLVREAQAGTRSLSPGLVAQALVAMALLLLSIVALGAVCITFELEGAIESLIISAGLLSSTFVDGGRVTLPRTFAAWTYVALAFLVQQLRLLLALVMVEQTIQIVGTSDGPLNILLNATALMFLLGLDSGFGIGATRSAVPETTSGTPVQQNLSSSVTSKHSVWRPLRGQAAALEARRAAGALGPCPLDRVAKTVCSSPWVWLQPVVQGLSLAGAATRSWSARSRCSAQTSKGRIVIADDYIYEKHPSVANTYQVCQLVTAVILCAVVNWSACYATRNLKLAVASTVLDFLALMVIYAVLYEWVIGQLLWFGKSAETDAFIWGFQRLYRAAAPARSSTRAASSTAIEAAASDVRRGPTGRAIHAERP